MLNIQNDINTGNCCWWADGAVMSVFAMQILYIFGRLQMRAYKMLIIWKCVAGKDNKKHITEFMAKVLVFITDTIFGWLAENQMIEKPYNLLFMWRTLFYFFHRRIILFEVNSFIIIVIIHLQMSTTYNSLHETASHGMCTHTIICHSNLLFTMTVLDTSSFIFLCLVCFS